jgi:hypothetical protein
MSDVTVSIVQQSVTVAPVVQSLTIGGLGSASPMALDDLTDVTMVGTANGYILRYNGTAWSGVPGSTYFAGASHTHPQSDVTGLVAFVSNTNTTLLDQADMISQAQFDISNLQSFDATLGTAATLNFNISGDATSTQVVRGGDSRLTNARTPTAHTHVAADVTDATATGKTILTSSASVARTTLGLGTSSVVDVPAAGNATSAQVVLGTDTRLTDSRTPSAHTHIADNISDATTYGKQLLQAGSVAIQRGYLGLGTSALLDVPSAGNATSGQVVKGNDGRLSDARTPTAHVHSYSDITSGYPALTSAQNVLSGSTVSLNNSTWTSLGSVTLAAGTWLVQSTVTVQHSTGTEKVATRIGTSSSTYASTEQRTAAANINMSMALASVITIASSTAIHHYGISATSTGTAVQYQTSIPSGSVVSSATLINAVRIA